MYVYVYAIYKIHVLHIHTAYVYICVYTYTKIVHCMRRMNWRKTRTKEKWSEVGVIRVRYNGGLNKGCGSRDGKT